ncbi:MAG: glycosyltransferase family 39 protein, partial [Caldilineaceae bacterium]
MSTPDPFPSSLRSNADSERRAGWVAAALFLALAAQMTALIFVRRVNLDEGWYLWAAKLVYTGKILYADFAYTQTPLLPYVYGAIQQIFGAGILQGRIFTAILALASWAIYAQTARRLRGPWAGVIVLAVLVTSPFVSGLFSYTATYALTSLLLAAALYVGVTVEDQDRRLALATVFAALAVCVRLSVVAAFAPFALYLLLSSPRRGRALLWIGGAALVTFGVVMGPFLLVDADAFLYDILRFHTDRLLRLDWRFGHAVRMAWRTAVDFAPILVVVYSGLAWTLLTQRRRRQADAPSTDLQLAAAAMALGLFAAHLIPRTADSYYNTLQLPLLAIVFAVVIVDLGAGHLRRRWAALIVLLALNLWTQGAAVLRDGFVPLPLRNQFTAVDEAASFLQQVLPDDAEILTFNTHLALAAGMGIPPGYEMSIFSYRPTWSTEQAQRYNVINNELLLADLAQGADAIALTTFDLEMLYGERDLLLSTLHETYHWSATVDDFDPVGDPLRIYLPPRFEPFPMQQTLNADLEDGLTLLGYDLRQSRQGSQWLLHLTLYWRTDGQPSTDYTVFAQVL